MSPLVQFMAFPFERFLHLDKPLPIKTDNILGGHTVPIHEIVLIWNGSFLNPPGDFVTTL